MAKGKKTGGRNFQKGVQTFFSKLTEEEKLLRKLSRESFKNIIARNCLLTTTELQEKIITQQDSLPAVEIMVINILLSAIYSKDEKKMEALMLRCIGKSRDIVHEKKSITVTILDSKGKEITNDKLEELDTGNLKLIVDAMLKGDSQDGESGD